MKSIGFVDFYISEWHANNYPTWIKEANERLGTDYEVKYVWAEQEISPVDGVRTEEWCKAKDAVQCESIAELCEKSDVIMILAPTNPEKHLQYAKEVLPFGKPTYIDKTFAPDPKTAEEIFKIAKTYNTPFFSTSALRYGEELQAFQNADNLLITGGGSNLDEYIIHTVEMAVILLNSPAEKVKVEELGVQRICSVVTKDNRKAVIVFSPALGFGITGLNSEGQYIHKDVVSAMFLELMVAVLKFYDDGMQPFDPEQTMEAMRLRSALLEADHKHGEWLFLA